MDHEQAGWAERGLLALLAGLAGLAALLLLSQALAPQPIRLAGTTIDRLNATLLLLVAGIGAVTYRFALRYLAGEPGQRRFLHWLAFTTAAAFVLMIATHMALLFAAWSLTSLGLHQLLTFYRERAEARRTARKKFLISRIGDVALLAAAALIWLAWGTLDIPTALGRAAAEPGASTSVALLIALAALAKSAQFPFHSWLPETMEAPTPVSALMHAGIINAGGVLLLRFAPLLAQTPGVLLALVLVGAVTAALGMLVMWAQPDVKRTLAWSTVSQMGFMFVQCGLAAFPAAVLHIVGHGCYKAWAFLRTGGLPQARPAPAATPQRMLVLSLAGTLAALPALALAAQITGFNPAHSPGELALSAIVALSIGQLWAALLAQPLAAVRYRIALAIAASAGAALLALGLYRAAAAFYAPVFGAFATPRGPVAWTTALLAVLACAGLTIARALWPAAGRSPTGRALVVHATHGFYLGQIANQAVDRLWNDSARRRLPNV